MRPADMDDNQLASTIRPPTVRPGELASEQTAQPTVRARRRGRTASHEVWSPQTTLAYCSRSRTPLVLGAWRPSHPWRSHDRDRHSTESALLTGGLLMGTAFWALHTREPAAPHVCSVSLGHWLLVAHRCGTSSCLASQNSQTAGLVMVTLSA